MTLYNTQKSAMKDVNKLWGDLQRKQNETGLEQLTELYTVKFIVIRIYNTFLKINDRKLITCRNLYIF